MPIFVNDYEWHQNGSTVTLKFGLQGQKSQNVDIVFTSSYIKVNFSPYLFEAFLSYKIDPALSSSIYKDGSLHFNLVKVCNQEWDSFSIKPVDKKESQKLRNEAMGEYNLLQISKVQSKQEVIQELSKLAISKQIEVNEMHNELQKKSLLQETYKFFNDCNTGNEISTQGDKQSKLRARSISTCSEGSGVASEGDYDGDEESIYHSSFENIPALANQNILYKEEHCKRKEKVSVVFQSPRQCSVIKIRHSTHKLGLPKRKSTSYVQSEINEDNEIALEQEKIVAINRVKIKNFQIAKTNNNNIQPNEENLEEVSYEDIKEEAKQNFEDGKHEETIRLYSKMIKMNHHHASNYSNRAASYLSLNMNEKAIKDCTKAVMLLEPPTQENIKSRLLCFIRRGTAYVRLHNYQRGLTDYKTALELDPENNSLAKDIAAITLFLNISSDTGEEEDIIDNSGETDGCISVVQNISPVPKLKY